MYSECNTCYNISAYIPLLFVKIWILYKYPHTNNSVLFNDVLLVRLDSGIIFIFLLEISKRKKKEESFESTFFKDFPF